MGSIIGQGMGKNDTPRWFALFRTILFAFVVMGTVGVYLPFYLGLLNGGLHRDWRLVGIFPFVIGAYVALRCAFAFAWQGDGTPAPIDPPKVLVVSGMYRYVRNPMYFGMGLLLAGEFVLWGSNWRWALIYLAGFSAAVTLFTIFYEEPTLRRMFPQDYEEYSRNVPRLFPKLRPWDPAKKKSAAQS
jgi:protein-S-isoprenylcysteine O-methyltransferase Ste14